jgi:hypothetical protein
VCIERGAITPDPDRDARWLPPPGEERASRECPFQATASEGMELRGAVDRGGDVAQHGLHLAVFPVREV